MVRGGPRKAVRRECAGYRRTALCARRHVCPTHHEEEVSLDKDDDERQKVRSSLLGAAVGSSRRATSEDERRRASRCNPLCASTRSRSGSCVRCAHRQCPPPPRRRPPLLQIQSPTPRHASGHWSGVTVSPRHDGTRGRPGSAPDSDIVKKATYIYYYAVAARHAFPAVRALRQRLP